MTQIAHCESYFSVLPLLALAFLTYLPFAGAAVVVDFFLGDGKTSLGKVQTLSRRNTPEAFKTLGDYVSEALRMNPAIRGVCKRAKEKMKSPIALEKGDLVWVSFSEIGQSVANPDKVDPARNAYLKRLLCKGFKSPEGEDFNMFCVTVLVKEVRGRIEFLVVHRC